MTEDVRAKIDGAVAELWVLLFRAYATCDSEAVEYVGAQLRHWGVLRLSE